MSQLRDHYATFREMNAEVIALAAVDRKPLAGFARELNLPFPVLSDVTAEVYRAFGLGKGLAIHPRTPFEFARLVWNEKRLYKPVGNVMQIGGDFIVDDAGLLRYAHTRRRPGPAVLPILGRILKIVFTAHRQWERLLPPFIAAVERESALAWETLPTAAIVEGIARHEAQSAALLANHAATIIATEPIVQILQKLTRTWLGDEDGQIAITLLSGLTGNKTMETNRALWRLAASTRGNDALRQAIAGARGGGWREPIALARGGTDFLTGFDAFLKPYGHRTRGYDMINPTWREQPDQALELLQLSLDDSVADPGEGEARKAAEREAAARAARQRLSLLKCFLFDRVLALAQTYFRLRENQQFYMMQGVPLTRRALLTLGRRLQEAGLLGETEDVFFLENKEVRALATKMAGLPTDGLLLPADSLHLVAERRAEFERNRQIDAPIHLGGELAQPEAQTSGALRGIPASRGVVTGRAHLVRGPDDFGKVRRGEIIVAPATTPAWTPLFGVAAGLVTEFGGLLSHSGVVAREYGLPAVLGVSEVMRLLHDGDEIEVDGDRGEVRVSRNMCTQIYKPANGREEAG